MLVNSCCYNESAVAYIDGLNSRNLFLTLQQVVKFKVKEYTKSVPDEGPLPSLKALVLCPLVLERERERDPCWEVNEMAAVSPAPLCYTLSPCTLMPAHFA